MPRWFPDNFYTKEHWVQQHMARTHCTREEAEAAHKKMLQELFD